MFDDVETLEVNPHGMSGVRDSPVGECIRRKQIAELIVPARMRNAKHRDKRSPNHNYPGPHHKYGKPSPLSQATEGAPEGLKC
jgi:hypothetical protein